MPDNSYIVAVDSPLKIFPINVRDNDISSYSITPSLPAGLSIAKGSAKISGIPTEMSAVQTYTIRKRGGRPITISLGVYASIAGSVYLPTVVYADVRLYSNGNVIATTKTDILGQYKFVFEPAYLEHALVIEVQGNALSQSTDKETNTPIPFTSEDKLVAVVPIMEDKNTTIYKNITPISTIMSDFISGAVSASTAGDLATKLYPFDKNQMETLYNTAFEYVEESLQAVQFSGVDSIDITPEFNELIKVGVDKLTALARKENKTVREIITVAGPLAIRAGKKTLGRVDHDPVVPNPNYM